MHQSYVYGKPHYFYDIDFLDGSGDKNVNVHGDCIKKQKDVIDIS